MHHSVCFAQRHDARTVRTLPTSHHRKGVRSCNTTGCPLHSPHGSSVPSACPVEDAGSTHHLDSPSPSRFSFPSLDYFIDG
jgi:hypothetical protein